MKRIIWFLLLCLLIIGYLGAEEETGKASQIHFTTLDNGLSVLLDPHPGSPLVHVAVAIGLGSRDEKEGENGLVHLLEHVMLLGGSRTIPAEAFSSRLRSAGVYFNAHTDHDLMTLEFTLTPAFLPEVLDLAREKLFSTLMIEETLNREKRAIAEEINQLSDDPLARGRQEILSGLFAGHAYARPIQGDMTVIEKVQPAELEAWYHRYFVPNNMALAVIGGVDASAMDLISSRLGNVPAGPAVDRRLPLAQKPTRMVERALTMDIEENHLFLGYPAPPQADKSRLAFDLLAQILGRGINPLMCQALRAVNPDLVQSFNLQYIPLDQAGLLFIHIRTEGNKIGRLRRDISRFFVDIARMPFAIEDLHPRMRQGAVDHMANAVTHLRMLYHSFQENGLSLASAYARSLMMQKEDQSDPYLTRLSKLKSRDLNRVVDTFLAGMNHVVVHIGPMEKK